MDMSTEVTTFTTGLRDGPVKTQLSRIYPETLEEAFAMALVEDYNARQARSYGSRSRPSPEMAEAEPMDLSVVQTQSGPSKVTESKWRGRCFRCQKLGHRAQDCRAPY
ncbi:hypothetical protein PINS_up016065 [Pythium insidiosum]|nr:hypothetical protein PINS_up016065 [Pythium insidiosum]